MATIIETFESKSNAQRKETAEAAIIEVVEWIESEQREPDRWEAEHLAEAIGAVRSGFYVLACVLAVKACVPSDERAGEWSRRADTQCLDVLKLEMRRLAGEPSVR